MSTFLVNACLLAFALYVYRRGESFGPLNLIGAGGVTLLLVYFILRIFAQKWDVAGGVFLASIVVFGLIAGPVRHARGPWALFGTLLLAACLVHICMFDIGPHPDYWNGESPRLRAYKQGLRIWPNLPHVAAAIGATRRRPEYRARVFGGYVGTIVGTVLLAIVVFYSVLNGLARM
jgi:hypothetical protein